MHGGLHRSGLQQQCFSRREALLVKIAARRQRKRGAALLTFGRLLLEGGRAAKSIPYFEEAVELAPSLAEAHFRLSLALRAGRPDSMERQVSCLTRAVALDPTFSPAWCNLSALQMRRDRHASALACAQRAVALSPDLSDAHYNVASTLRRLGRQAEAVELTWRTIDAWRWRESEKDPGAKTDFLDAHYRAPLDASSSMRRRVVDAPRALAAPAPPIVFVCVKWGTKYGAEYVNKLRHGVRRHLRTPHAFVCFTDDATDLDVRSGITAEPLPSVGEWHTWWNKATLFGPSATETIRDAAATLAAAGGGGGDGGGGGGDPDAVATLGVLVVYIDLDSVIVGALDDLTQYRGTFATLGTRGFVNEGREGGFNSSVMLWMIPPIVDEDEAEVEDAEEGAGEKSSSSSSLLAAESALAIHIYAPLASDFESITRVVHRFDHWLEMRIANADILQDIAPGVVVEYRAVCTETLPPSARLVTFPLQPKPHDLPAPWVKERWVLDSSSSSSSSSIERAPAETAAAVEAAAKVEEEGSRAPSNSTPSMPPLPTLPPLLRGPDFVIVGAMKGGTESIVATLRRHPECWMPAEETHFFDKSVAKRSHPTADLYRAEFDHERAKNAAVRVVGEKTPVYMHLPRAMKRLASTLPHAKIVVVLREPSARAWSHWNFWERDVSKFPSIFNELALIPGVGPPGTPPTTKRFTCQDVLRRGFYDDQIERIYSLFPPERVHIAIAERVWKAPIEEYDRLFRFLGISEWAADEGVVGRAPRRVNTTSNKTVLDATVRAKLDAVYAPHVTRLFELLGDSVPAEWRQ